MGYANPEVIYTPAAVVHSRSTMMNMRLIQVYMWHVGIGAAAKFLTAAVCMPVAQAAWIGIFI